MQKVNYREDFEFILQDKNGDCIEFPSYDWVLNIWTWGSTRKYEAASIDGKLTNVINDGGKIRVIVNAHRLRPGKLVAEMYEYLPSETLPDKTQKNYKYYDNIGVELVAGDVELDEVYALAIHDYIKGDPFTYDDFTEEQLDDLRKPATEAAAKADAATAKAEQATEDALTAAKSARGAANSAREATDSANIATAECRSTTAACTAATESTTAAVEKANSAAEKAAEVSESAEMSEAQRVSAESARATAEKARVTAEKNRVSEESSRVTAEKSRVSAESKRADAEDERKATFDQTIADLQSAENAYMVTFGKMEQQYTKDFSELKSLSLIHI